MRPHRLFALFVFPFLLSVASSQVVYDTVSVRSIGPGMMHYRVIAPAIPWNLNIITVDLTNPYIEMESVKALDRLAGRETVRAMKDRKNQPGRVAVGAINGDFYAGDGSPINIQVVRGEFVRGPIARPAIGFTATDRPLINTFSFSSSVALADTQATIHGVNIARGTDQLILYNSYKGATTGTNSFGREALVQPLEPWLVNDTIDCVVESVQDGVGNMAIPAGKAVLSGHGVSSSLVLSRVQTGDTVRLYPGLSPSIPKIREIVGGNPNLVVNGTVEPSESPREPRTAAGFSADSSLLYLITVDGRQAVSVGMTFDELASFMVAIGVHRGFNLDGGGSTTMLVRDSVMNFPSDGGERQVSNGLMVMSTAPTGTLAAVSLSPRSARVSQGDPHVFQVFGIDQYGNPVPPNPGNVQFSCDASIGSIDPSSGVFTAGPGPATGWVRLQYGAMKDSARVTIKTLSRIDLTPVDVVTDTARVIQYLTTAYDSDGLVRAKAPSGYLWTSTDPSVAVVTSPGLIKGVSPGETMIIASAEGTSDTARLRVEIGEAFTIIDSLNDVSDFTLSSVKVDSFTVAEVDSFPSVGERSFRLSYSFTASADTISYIYLDTDIPLFGVPDSINMTARTQNHNHRLYYIVEDDNGERFRLYSSKLMNKLGIVDTIRAPFLPNQEVVTGSTFHFPVRLKRVEIQLVYNRVAGTPYSGVLFLDNLRVSYPAKTVTAVRDGGSDLPSEFRLEHNYPNPFNPSTTIRFSLASAERISLRIYDINGRIVRTLLNNVESRAGEREVVWDGRNDEGVSVASGVYFYALRLRNAIRARRMVLVK